MISNWNLVTTHGDSIYVVDDEINPVVGDLGPWAKGKLCDEHEGMGSPEASDAMMEQRSTHSQPQSASQLPMEYKTVFHPCSNWPLLFQSFEEFHVNAKTFTPPTDNTPYYPFQVAGDFEFMEVALVASLNQAQVTLKNNMELCKACDATAVQLMPFCKHDVTMLYKKETLTYEVFAHPVWEWALDLLQNELLAPYFVWDPQCEAFKHFYDEPLMADCWWDIQSSLPDVGNTVPFGLIIYADKMKLSSFGTAKGYPVVVWFLRMAKRKADWVTQTSNWVLAHLFIQQCHLLAISVMPARPVDT
ncbi:hypothetical protein EDD16DRAFT_1523447 [Pisolithus croceorrhizus]|nr:hypothetical protein EDD16DRAFT_1523447 [Pisolithus croceorrhizus]